ncbi:hypothetical protein [Aliihoeflea sp. PC F10.4]
MPTEIALIMPATAKEWRDLPPHLQNLGANVRVLSVSDAAVAPADGIDLIAVLPERSCADRFDEIDIDTWLSTFERSIDTAFVATQSVSNGAQAAGKTNIVHVVEREAFFGGAGATSAISSFATAGLSRITALDLAGAGAHCNCVASGTSETDIETLAAILIHLAESDVTGQIIAVNGDEIHIAAQPRPIRVAQRDGGWDEELLAGTLTRWASAMPSPHETAKDLF